MHKATTKFFNKNGYCIINLFSNKLIEKLNNKIADRLNLFRKDLNINFTGKNLKNYHILKLTDNEHKRFIKGPTRYILLDAKVKKKITSNDIILGILNNYWGHSNISIRWVGSLKKNPMRKDVTGFRIARPQLNNLDDVGGVHYDLPYGRQKIPNKDHKAIMTIWCPLIGFSEKCTLKISPKSHIVKHPISTISEQNKYLSPVFKKNYVKKFKFIRPRLKKGQAIIFHPNLLHGGSHNRGKKTRVSIDLRIFNKKRIKLN